MKPHFLFITSSNLTTNPRCLKEVELAIEQEFQVSVIKFHFNNWTNKLERDLEKSLRSVNFYTISAGRKPFFNWFVATLYEKILMLISHKFNLKGSQLAIANSKRTWLLKKFIKGKSLNPDIVIAHNPAAFYCAYEISKKLKIPFGIDVEDYHPGEFVNEHAAKLMLQLMKAVLPHAAYVSFASPLIMEYTTRNISNKIENLNIINNCFSNREFLPPDLSTTNCKLRIVWFSQNIDFGRGLEKVIDIFLRYKDQFEITLIGNLRNDFAKFLLPYSDLVKIVSPLAQNQLHRILKNYDIGLAAEESRNNFNREICLTNKIWGYFQAGLFILASSTESQKQFINKHPYHGINFDIEEEGLLINAIELILTTSNEIRRQKVFRYQNALNFSWEMERKKLQDLWNGLVTNNN